MQRLRYLVLGPVLACSLALAGTAGAATTSFTFPTDFATSACGTTIQLSGAVHAVFTATPNSAGGVLFSASFNPQGVTGVDTSGNRYQGTGVTTSTTTVNAAATTTFVDNFRLIGHGSAPNFLVMQLLHITVDANGAVTAVAAQTSVTCT
jgi:hypothetical protein